MNRSQRIGAVVFASVVGAIVLFNLPPCSGSRSSSASAAPSRKGGERHLELISGSENADLLPLIKEFEKESKIKVRVSLRGTLDIMSELNRNGGNYDAVWASNSIWLYMLENRGLVKNAKSTSVSPIVFGIRRSKALELGLDRSDVRTADILAAIKARKLSFLTASATQTNAGASALLGLLSTFAGNPEVLSIKDLENEAVRSKLIDFYSGIERVSGSAEFLDEMFLSGSYDAMVSYESSLLRLNTQLEAEGKEALRLVYPVDGVSLSDSPLGYVDNGDKAKERAFRKFQDWALSSPTQAKLTALGRRAWYGGDVENPLPQLFKPEWGVDTGRYLVPVKYPQPNVIKAALALYQTELKKPSYTVFCLDFSGSMYGSGYNQLVAALRYVLNAEEAGKDFIQFSRKDSIVLIPFSTDVMEPMRSTDASDTAALLAAVEAIEPDGATNLYGAAEEALKLLASVDTQKFVCSVVLMTDGQANVGTLASLKAAYASYGRDVPLFCITFGSADTKQLKDIAKLSNARVFDGRADLIAAFKEVRGYN